MARGMSAARRASSKRMAEARPILAARSEGRCDRCGYPFEIDGDDLAFQAHHRLSRARGGGDGAANLLAVHAACHSVIHLEPENSTRQGWMLPSGSDPEAESLSFRGDAATLSDDGSVTWLVGETEDPDSYRDLLTDDDLGVTA